MSAPTRTIFDIQNSQGAQGGVGRNLTLTSAARATIYTTLSINLRQGVSAERTFSVLYANTKGRSTIEKNLPTVLNQMSEYMSEHADVAGEETLGMVLAKYLAPLTMAETAILELMPHSAGASKVTPESLAAASALIDLAHLVIREAKEAAGK